MTNADPASPPKELAASKELAAAWQRLIQVISRHESMLVAFSGGVDSALLLAAAKAALGSRAGALLCTGPFTPPWEAQRARRFARELGVALLEADCAELAIPEIRNNGAQRCYHCKHLRLKSLKDKAAELGFGAVAEGSHLGDAGPDRPGARAVRELGAVSPLAEAGLDKPQIRMLSRALSLNTAEVPSNACLASRIPFGVPIQADALERVRKAEGYLRELISGQIRVRDHFPLARLELDRDLLPQAATPPLRKQLVEAVLKAGYKTVCLDLTGYRAGGAGTS